MSWLGVDSPAGVGGTVGDDTACCREICAGCPVTLAAARCYELGGLARRTILLPWVLEHFPGDPGSRSLLFVTGLLVLMCALARRTAAAAQGIARGLARTMLRMMRAEHVHCDPGAIGSPSKAIETVVTPSVS